jgi:hypothetical protein
MMIIELNSKSNFKISHHHLQRFHFNLIKIILTPQRCLVSNLAILVLMIAKRMLTMITKS